MARLGRKVAWDAKAEQVVGDAEPAYRLELVTAGNPAGERIDARISLERGAE